MLTEGQVADLVNRLVSARIENRRDELVELVDGLVNGRSSLHALTVTSALAAVIAASLAPEHGRDFVVFRPRKATPAGPVDCAIEDLPLWEVCFGRMAVAIANQDHVAAGALFIGFVSHQRVNAARVLVCGIGRVAHHLTCPRCGHPDLRGLS